ncbi:MAG: squalene/phytoene synthase family protein [Pseudomonadota bacterium]
MTETEQSGPSAGTPTQEVRAIARSWNYDAFIAATLAPSAAQEELIALAAFVGDLERIVTTVQEPTLALIRIQWWRDALAAMRETGRSDHPIGSQLARSLRTETLPLPLMQAITDTFTDQLSAPEISDAQALKSFLAKRYATPLQLAARILRAAPDDALIRHAGEAYGAARLAGADAQALKSAGINVPGDEISALASAGFAELRVGLRTADKATRCAVLPASLAPLYLRAGPTGPTPLRRLLRLARVHWLAKG